MAKRALAVRPAIHIHLQQAEIHAQLQLFLAIFAHELPDNDLPRLVFPVVQ
ncbi:hypothetical protein SDC9_200866 [bioreactor metagenome]|uniref:Uncharacterized protein n=1 Tax=bioreactor metagenome TaxID=1076179 RepID=A0A645IQN2_9ZZZZ